MKQKKIKEENNGLRNCEIAKVGCVHLNNKLCDKKKKTEHRKNCVCVCVGITC